MSRAVRSISPARLLLIDYGLNEKLIQGICHGLDQLFSILTSYIGFQRIPMFGMIVNGQNQSEIFLPLSSTCTNPMEVQISLYKLQLLAQKWSMKSVTSLSWHSALQLALSEMNKNKTHLITMSSALFNLAQGLPWISALKTSNDDEHSDRINHRYTTGVLLLGVLMVSGSPYVFNRITCWVPAQFTGAYLSYTNNYCWISNTYYIASNQTIPHGEFDRKQAQIGYYQWTPLILLIFAFGFYFPRMMWRAMNRRSGIDLQYLIAKKNVDEIVHAIEYYCQANQNHSLRRFTSKRRGNYLRSLQLIVKLLYLSNSLTQLILIHMILGQPGWFYGFDVWYQVFIKNSVLTDSPYFPRVTLCDLRIREIGNLHRYTVQCVLPINMLNEKVFSLAWFCFAIVLASNFDSLTSTLIQALLTNRRIAFVRDLYRFSTSNTIQDQLFSKKFVEDYLKQDGIVILYLIHHNVDPFLISEVVRNLYQNYQLTHQEFQNPPPDSCDV